MKADELKKNVKKFNQGIVNIPFEGPLVNAVDILLALAKRAGYAGQVETEKHWEVLEKVCSMWATLYPESFEEFKTRQNWNKTNQKNKYAVSTEDNTNIRHLLEIPAKLYAMIRAVFPHQVFDRKFSLEFGRRMKLFRWADTQ